MHVCVCMYTYVCMYVCIHVNTHVCMWVCMTVVQYGATQCNTPLPAGDVSPGCTRGTLVARSGSRNKGARFNACNGLAAAGSWTSIGQLCEVQMYRCNDTLYGVCCAASVFVRVRVRVCVGTHTCSTFVSARRCRDPLLAGVAATRLSVTRTDDAVTTV